MGSRGVTNTVGMRWMIPLGRFIGEAARKPLRCAVAAKEAQRAC
jgi:hypothetical protein